MNKEINRIHWKCRRGMREIDLLLREFSQTKLDQLNQNELVMFEEILNYDDQKLYDFIFKKTSLDNNLHEDFINKFLKTFTKQGNF
ncbi:MAG: succinate dehydrogenase assembly factor 2 [Gammaproteobacteria bacterium]|jgi:antitoxin CptB|tara:strand:+ start:5203 stop:5460 length:258 start_codon:yes stop_codon:yes gene_type:complete